MSTSRSTSTARAERLPAVRITSLLRLTDHRRGLTLAELMLSLVLTLIAVLGLVGVVSYSLRAHGKTTGNHAANVVAANLLEDARVASWKDFDGSLAVSRRDVTGQPGYQYALTEKLENADLKRVDVSVYWTDREGSQQLDLWTKLVREE